MPAVKDWTRLLGGIPKGAWVALSHDEDRVLASGPELQEVLEKARETGETDPVVVRVPETEISALL
jgi:hypothetical protein